MQNEGQGNSPSGFRAVIHDASETIRDYAHYIDTSCAELALLVKAGANDGGAGSSGEDQERLQLIERSIAEAQGKIDAYRLRLDEGEAAGKDLALERGLLASCEEALSTIRKDKLQLASLLGAAS